MASINQLELTLPLAHLSNGLKVLPGSLAVFLSFVIWFTLRGAYARKTDSFAGIKLDWSSSAEEFHPHALTDPYVSLSTHTALIA